MVGGAEHEAKHALAPHPTSTSTYPSTSTAAATSATTRTSTTASCCPIATCTTSTPCSSILAIALAVVCNGDGAREEGLKRLVKTQLHLEINDMNNPHRVSVAFSGRLRRRKTVRKKTHAEVKKAKLAKKQSCWSTLTLKCKRSRRPTPNNQTNK